MLFVVSRVPLSLSLSFPDVRRILRTATAATAADVVSPSIVAIYAFIASRDESKMQLNERGNRELSMTTC